MFGGVDPFANKLKKQEEKDNKTKPPVTQKVEKKAGNYSKICLR